jgi:hypothetical protein
MNEIKSKGRTTFKVTLEILVNMTSISETHLKFIEIIIIKGCYCYSEVSLVGRVMII